MSEASKDEQEIIEQRDEKSLVLFGRDVSKIPCFRNSFYYGTLGGIAFGLTYFMFSSKVGKSVNYSVYAFSMITMGYWMQCRYEYSKTKFEMMRLQELLRQRSILEGSELEKQMQPQSQLQPEVVEI